MTVVDFSAFAESSILIIYLSASLVAFKSPVNFFSISENFTFDFKASIAVFKVVFKVSKSFS